MEGLSIAGFFPFPAYVFFPHVNGKYLYLIMCAIWFFMVNVKRTTKYTKRIGQNTGMLNKDVNVIQNAVRRAFIADCLHKGLRASGTSVRLIVEPMTHQNLNSGSFRPKGL
jgi:hypothetical protein